MTAKIPFKWPFSLDLVKQSLDANKDQRLLAFYTGFFERHGPNLEQKLLGGTGFVTCDPANIEAVLSTHFQNFTFGSRTGAMWHLLGNGILTQEGVAWKLSRDTLRHQFVQMQYQNLGQLNTHVDRLITHLSSCSDVLDLQPILFRFTLDVTSASFLGRSVNSLDNQYSQTFADSFDTASFITAIRTRLSDFYWAYTTPSFLKACAEVKTYANTYVEEVLKGTSQETGKGSVEGGFIKDLYEKLQDPALVRDQLLHILLAGRDSTACLLSWTFYLLVRHPPALDRLQAELAAIQDPAEPITRANIRKMPYLECVLKETLRLYPSAPINIRTCVKATMLPRGGGADGQSPTLLRRGMGIGFSVFHMHRRKDIYGDDALSFRPERWEHSRLADIGWAYLPFNGGPRVCLGKDFALMEASCATIRIIQAFPNLKLPEDVKVEEIGQERHILTLTLRSATGCRVQLR